MHRPWIAAVAAVLALCPAAASAQDGSVSLPQNDSARIAVMMGPRTVAAARIVGTAPTIDGALDDAAWSSAQLATDFIEQGPHPGALSRYRTEFRVLFDDQAIYFGIRGYDQNPPKVVAPYLRRDDESRSDWFFVEIDSRHDHRTGFGFGINPRGVQVDATFDAYINYDYAWDAVWQGASKIDSTGWSTEIRIPFSQLPYSAAPGTPMEFGLNVYRSVTRGGQSANWTPRMPTVAVLESVFNTITGLVAPAAPERLELLPYSAAKATFAPSNGNPLIDPTKGSGYAGADIRWRLKGGFTATAAIRPDFGQVEADPSQINLTTFESFFPEQRPFFVEGASQFAFDVSLPFTTRGNAFTNEAPFYSRRIGGAPQGSIPGGALYSDMATSTTLLGAAKVAGRTSNGWSAGAMTALTDASEARFLDQQGSIQRVSVEPTTGFGVLRLARASQDGGSAVGVIGTGVTRFGMDSALGSERIRDAFSVGVDGRHRFGNGDYEVSALAMGSHVQGSREAVTGVLHGPGHFYQRPDAGYLHDDTTRTAINGAAAQLRVAKLGGQWHWSAIGHLITPGFELNDLGFQRNADWLLAVGAFEYQHYRPGHTIRRWAAGVDQIGGGWSFNGDRRAALVGAHANLTLRSNWAATITAKREFTSLSTDMLRGGPGVLLPPSSTVGATIVSDFRKPWQITTAATYSSEPGSGSHSFDFSPSITWRPVDRLALTFAPEYTRSIVGWQFVHATPESGQPQPYLVGRLDQTTTSLTARADFAFSSRMTLQLYAQPFLSSGAYTHFQQLRSPRATDPAQRFGPVFAPNPATVDPSGYTFDLDGNGSADATLANPDFSSLAFNLNLVWRWEYRPGSTVYFVWTQRRSADGPEGDFSLNRNLGDLFRGKGENVVLVKVSYRIGL